MGGQTSPTGHLDEKNKSNIYICSDSHCSDAPAHSIAYNIIHSRCPYYTHAQVAFAAAATISIVESINSAA